MYKRRTSHMYLNINKIFTLYFIKFNTYLYFVILVSLTAILMHSYKTKLLDVYDFRSLCL